MEKPISSLQVRPKIQEWEALEVRGNVGGRGGGWHIPVCPLRVRKSAMQEFSLLRSVLLKDLNCLREEVMVHIWLMRSFENWAPPPHPPPPPHTHTPLGHRHCRRFTCEQHYLAQETVHLSLLGWSLLPWSQLPYLGHLPFVGADLPSPSFNIQRKGRWVHW